MKSPHESRSFPNLKRSGLNPTQRDEFSNIQKCRFKTMSTRKSVLRCESKDKLNTEHKSSVEKDSTSSYKKRFNLNLKLSKCGFERDNKQIMNSSIDTVSTKLLGKTKESSKKSLKSSRSMPQLSSRTKEIVETLNTQENATIIKESLRKSSSIENSHRKSSDSSKKVSFHYRKQKSHSRPSIFQSESETHDSCRENEEKSLSYGQVYIIGGGDETIELALSMSKHSLKVYVVHNCDYLSCTSTNIADVENKNIDILLNCVVTDSKEIIPGIHSITIHNIKSGKIMERKADEIFFTDEANEPKKRTNVSRHRKQSSDGGRDCKLIHFKEQKKVEKSCSQRNSRRTIKQKRVTFV